MSKVFCFGELLLRYSPRLNQEWIREASMPVYIGGAELNTAIALSRWGIDVSYMTALPDHYLSAEIIQHINEKGINASDILFQHGRVGSYYLPQGQDLKAAGVIYDRSHSSFANLKKGMINWKEVLSGHTWFHFSAITPALSQELADVCKEAAEAASEMGLTVSIDLNYRAKLWQYGKQPSEVMPELVRYCNVVMGNVWAAEKMLDIRVNDGIEQSRELCLKQAEETSSAIAKKFTGCTTIANTFRFDEGEGIRYYAALYNNHELCSSTERITEKIIDKVGSGDTFMAGLIFGSLENMLAQETIDFATAAAFDKLFIKGDSTLSSVDQIKRSYPVNA